MVFLSLRKIEQLRLCVEITEKKNSTISGNDGARDKKKSLFSVECSEVESRYEDYNGGYCNDPLQDYF